MRKGGNWTTSTAATVAPILNVASEVVTAAIEWVGEYVTLITSQPLLLIGIVLTFVGLGIGLIRRMMKL